MLTQRRWIAQAAMLGALAALMAGSLACNTGSKADDSTPAPSAALSTRPPPQPTPTAIVIPVPTFSSAPPSQPGNGNLPQLVKADVKLTITDGKFTLDQSRVTANEIYFSANNDGSQPHSIAIVKWDGDPSALPVGQAGRVTGVQRHIEIDPLDARGFELFEIEYIEGQYVLFCDLPGHYARGEYAAITALTP